MAARRCGRAAEIETYAFPAAQNKLRAYLARTPPSPEATGSFAATLCAVELAAQLSGRAFTEEGIDAVTRMCVRRTLAKRCPLMTDKEADRIAAHYCGAVAWFAQTECARRTLSPLYGLESGAQFRESQIFVLE